MIHEDKSPTPPSVTRGSVVHDIQTLLSLYGAVVTEEKDVHSGCEGLLHGTVVGGREGHGHGRSQLPNSYPHFIFSVFWRGVASEGFRYGLVGHS
jgi:hypothetical protein